MQSSQIWVYRDTTLSQRNLAGLSVEAIDGQSAKSTMRRTTRTAASSSSTQGRGSSARRSCCRPES